MSQIKIESIVSANPTKAWEFYTNPDHITKWNFASDDWQCPRATNDLKVGGKYFARMEAKDGSFGFDFEAIYEEVIPQKKIVYALGDGRKVVTQFESMGEKTKIVTVFDADQSHSEEMQKGGWQSILNNFKKHVEQ